MTSIVASLELGMMEKPSDIEKQLREAIIKGDISRYALAKKTGVAEAVLSRFVNGSRTITMETGAKLAKVLKLELRPVKDAGKGR